MRQTTPSYLQPCEHCQPAKQHTHSSPGADSATPMSPFCRAHKPEHVQQQSTSSSSTSAKSLQPLQPAAGHTIFCVPTQAYIVDSSAFQCTESQSSFLPHRCWPPAAPCVLLSCRQCIPQAVSRSSKLRADVGTNAYHCAGSATGGTHCTQGRACVCMRVVKADRKKRMHSQLSEVKPSCQAWCLLSQHSWKSYLCRHKTQQQATQHSSCLRLHPRLPPCNNPHPHLRCPLMTQR